MAYVADSGTPTMMAIDLTTGTTRVVTLPFRCSSLAVTAAHGYAYVASSRLSGRGSPTGSAVVPVNLTTYQVGAAIPAGYGPISEALTPNGKLLLVADMGTMKYNGGRTFSVTDAYTLTVISTSSRKVVRTINVGPGPGAVAVTPNGKTAYVALTGTPSHTLHEIVPVNLSTFRTGAPIATGPAPMGIAVSPDNGLALIANSGWWLQPGNTASLVSLRTSQVVHTFHVGPAPLSDAISPHGTLALVANSGWGMSNNGNSLTPINLRTDRAGEPIVVGYSPSSVAITPQGTRAWVTLTGNESGGTIVSVNLRTFTTGKSYPAGKVPETVVLAYKH